MPHLGHTIDTAQSSSVSPPCLMGQLNAVSCTCMMARSTPGQRVVILGLLLLWGSLAPYHAQDAFRQLRGGHGDCGDTHGLMRALQFVVRMYPPY